MPDLAENDIIEVTIDGRQDGQQVLLTHHYIVTAVSGTYVDLYSAYGAIAGWLEGEDGWANQYREATSVDLINLFVTVQKIHPQRFVRYVTPYTGGSSGVAGDAMPANTAAAITLRGDLALPSDRGTKHIGAVPIAWVSNSLMTPAALEVYDDLANAMLIPANISNEDPASLEMLPIIYHRVNPAVSALAKTYVLGQTARIMRRRTVGLGS